MLVVADIFTYKGIKKRATQLLNNANVSLNRTATNIVPEENAPSINNISNSKNNVNNDDNDN